MSDITFDVLKEAMLARGWEYKSNSYPLHSSTYTWSHVFIKGSACFYSDYTYYLKSSDGVGDYYLQEVYDIITKKDSLKQVVLKLGDHLCGMYESVCGKDITGFTEQGEPINSSNTMCAFKSSTCDWYVNGMLYKRADILLPTDVVNNAAAPIKNATMHDSDCSQHNEPAYPNKPCDCSASGKVVLRMSDVVLCSSLTPNFHILTSYNDILVLKDGTVIEDGYHFSPWAKKVTIAYDSGDYEYGDEYNVVYYKCGLQDIISIDGINVTQPIKIKNRSI